MVGWRARIGVIVPSANTTTEWELARMVPEGVSVHAARAFMPEVRTEEEKVQAEFAMNEAAVTAAVKVASVKADVIAWACTNASFIKGSGYDREIADNIARACGVQAFTTSTAVAEACKALGVKRVAMATPYADGIAEKEKEFLERGVDGLRVIGMRNLGIIPTLPKGELFPGSAYRAAREVNTSEADCIFISCTNWRTMEIISPLEADLGKPVITSNQATLWFALNAIGIPGSAQFGRLMSVR